MLNSPSSISINFTRDNEVNSNPASEETCDQPLKRVSCENRQTHLVQWRTKTRRNIRVEKERKHPVFPFILAYLTSRHRQLWYILT